MIRDFQFLECHEYQSLVNGPYKSAVYNTDEDAVPKEFPFMVKFVLQGEYAKKLILYFRRTLKWIGKLTSMAY